MSRSHPQQSDAGSPGSHKDEFKVPTKRPSVFSKSMKKLTKSSSILNFNSVLAGNDSRDISPQQSSPSDSGNSSKPSYEENGFQAIGYNTTADTNKEPVHVMHLPERSITPSLPSPRKVSNSSQSSIGDKPPPAFSSGPSGFSSDARNNSISSNGSFSSLDPKSRSTSHGDNQSNLAAVGLNLAGFGLSNDDLFQVPPRPVNRSNSRSKSTPLNTIYQNGSSSSLHDNDDMSVYSRSSGVPAINTRVRPSGSSKPSATSVPQSTSISQTAGSSGSPSGTQGSPKTLVNHQSPLLQSFTAVASHMNQIPEPEIVDVLFEKLLSIRAFSEKAVQKLREQPLKRKWELLLRENETNVNFDLKLLMNRAVTSQGVSDSEGTGHKSSAEIESARSIASSGNYIANHKREKIKDGSPEWYVQKIFGGKLTTKDYRKLEKKLSVSDKNHNAAAWLSDFVNSQGEAALSVILSRINKKSIKSNEEFDREYHIIKCLKHILSQVDSPEDNPSTPFIYSGYANKLHIVRSITFSLISPRLATRILVTEVLIFLTYNQDSESLSLILESLTALQDNMGDFIRFQPWLTSFESFIDTYFIGDRSSKVLYNASMKDYSLTSLLLINGIIGKAESIKLRINLRRDLTDSRLNKIIDKLRVISEPRIDEEIEKYEVFAEADYNTYFGLADTSHSVESGDYEVDDLDGVYQQVKQLYLSTDISAEGELKSILARLLALKETDRPPEETHRLLKLAETVIQNVFMDASNFETNENATINDTIQELFEKVKSGPESKETALLNEELSDKVRTLKSENEKLRREASLAAFDDNMEALRGENTLSANKIADQERQINQLKDHIRSLNEKLENSERSSVQGSTALSPIKSSTIASRGRNVMIDELNSKLGKDQKGSAADPIYIPDRRSSNFSEYQYDSSSKQVVSKSPTRAGKFGHLKEDSDHSFHIPRPPTPPPLFAKTKSSTSLLNSHGPVETKVDPKVEPPPAPPVPEFLENIAKEKDSSQKPSLPPPPPPPPVPQFLEKLSSASSTPPPPPPPVPQFLEKLTNSTESSKTPPPPPPPVPSFLGNASKSQSPAAPPPPPPPPPPPANIIKANSPSGNTSPAAKQQSESPAPESLETTPVPDPKSVIPAIKPRAKLKQMHWDKIDDIDQTFWYDIEHGKLSDQLKEKGILDDVEKHFVVKSAAIKKRKDLQGDASKAGQPKKISLLTRDLAQQFGINLHMFASFDVEELVLKVLHCDKDILENVTVLEFFNSDLLSEFNETTLRNFMPYSRTVSDPQSKPKMDPNVLERADRVYLELCFNLRHYWKSRSRALLMMHTYSRDYLDLLRKLRIVDEACASIKNSESLKHVLGIIRSVGNFMNDDSKRALGFKLGTLQRLKFMKDDTNSMHFLHYVEKIIRGTFPEYGSFVDELNVLLHVQNISVEQIENDCQEFDRHVAAVTSSIERGNLSDKSVFHPEDRILDKIASPLESAKIKNSLLQSHLKKTIDEHKSLMTYFGENSKDNTSRNTFFEKFSTFVTEFKKAHIENIQKEEEQNAAEARMKVIETSRANKEKKTGSPDLNSEEDSQAEDTTNTETANEEDESDNGSTVMDTLLDKLRSSAPSFSSSSSSTKERRNNDRRRKALSFYSSNSVDETNKSEPNLPTNLEQNSLYSLDNESETYSNNEYESVSDLKRRLTRRRRGEPITNVNASQSSLASVNGSSGSLNSNSTLLRTQAMLNKLRKSEENLLKPNEETSA